MDERAGAEAKESQGSVCAVWEVGGTPSISRRIMRPRSLVIMAVMDCRSEANS